MTVDVLALVLCSLAPIAITTAVMLAVLWIRDHRRQSAAIDQLAADLSTLQASAADHARDLWLRTLPDLTYRNEIEVEAKFIAPLLAHLGIVPRQIALRVPVAVPVGRNSAAGQADWTVSTTAGEPIAVVEAKGPSQSLNGTVHAQARSYAYALNVPYILLTNGYRIQLYHRGVQTDTLLIDTITADLADHWPTLAKAFSS